MTVGCNQPIGLPNYDVHAAMVAMESCYVGIDENLTGHVDWYQGESSIWDYYSRTYGTITRGYFEYLSRAYPRKNGFCIFNVPSFTPSGGEVLACTLYYYQSSHSGSADLVVKWLPSAESWPMDDLDSLYWLIWNGADTVAVDTYHASDTWYKIPFTSAGRAAMFACIGGSFVTGWVYPGSSNGTYADVSGVGANAPYIKVWYEE
ncbi:hypothetical protein JXD38_11835 [candidate division WOR-3 bacterium]|nr:hypothetical protein [candidate division WOR-3 bacterium]